MHLHAIPPGRTTLVDSCVLLDVLTNDPEWGPWSEQALEAAQLEGRIAINSIVYGEVAGGFHRIEDLNDAIPEVEIERLDLPYEAAFLAGMAFKDYKRRGGLKRSPPPDFYIGGHAVLGSYRLLTRDVKRFRTYFPRLELICPN